MRGRSCHLIQIIAVAAAVALSAPLCTSPAAAQTPAPLAHTTDLWATGTLGVATVGHGSGAAVAGQLALSRAVGQRVITVRSAGAADYSDYAGDRGYADVGLLVGMRAANPEIPGPGNRGGTTASISLGLAGLYYNQPSTVSSPERSGLVPAMAFDADIMAHLRLIGVGVSIFGASGTKERYLGVGLTVGLGKIH